MESFPTNNDNENEIYEYFIFHDPIEKVHEAFTNLDLLATIFSPKIRLDNILRETTLDDEGNEVTFSILQKYKFTIKTINVKKSKYKYEFTLRTIYYPINYCSIDVNIQILWDSVEEITIFHGNIIVSHCAQEKEIMKILKENNILPCKQIDKFLKKTIKNLEENESISINVNIRIAWEFILKMENLKFFFPLGKITIKEDNNQIIKILDETSNNEIKLIRKEDIESDLSKMVYQLELFDSVIPMPKQLIEICLIKIREELTLMEFKHIILEYIPYDALISNSRDKQKILKKIKKLLESNNK